MVMMMLVPRTFLRPPLPVLPGLLSPSPSGVSRFLDLGNWLDFFPLTIGISTILPLNSRNILTSRTVLGIKNSARLREFAPAARGGQGSGQVL